MFGKKKNKGEAAESEAEAAATPADGEGAEGGEAPKKKGKGLILIIAGAVLLLGGGGGAAAFLLLGKKDAHAEAGAHGEKAGEHGEKKGGEHKPKKKKKDGGGGHGGGGDKPAAGAPVISEGPDGEVFYTLPDIVVNVQSPEGRNTFLKLKLTLELPDHEAAEHLEPNAPRLNDMFTTFLRELRPEDLSGSQGTYQLRAEILRRVNLVAAPVEVKAVLIEEMLIQG
jgi:flagellar FliL protein